MAYVRGWVNEPSAGELGLAQLAGITVSLSCLLDEPGFSETF